MKRFLLFTFLVAGVVSCGREPYVKIVDLAKLSPTMKPGTAMPSRA